MPTQDERRILAWDFDGVLVDTLHECHLSYNGALSEFDLSPLTAEEFSFERKTAVQATDFFAQYFLRQAGDMAYTPAKVEAAFERHRDQVLALREAYHKHRDARLESVFDSNPTYPGIPAVLATLKDQGIRMAVVSARDDMSLKKYLKAKDLAGYFDKAVGSSAFFAKSHQLKPLQVESLGKYGKDDIWFVDDMPSVLFSLKDHARLFHADWGYGRLEEHLGVVQPDATLRKKERALVTVLKKPADILSLLKVEIYR